MWVQLNTHLHVITDDSRFTTAKKDSEITLLSEELKIDTKDSILTLYVYY